MRLAQTPVGTWLKPASAHTDLATVGDGGDLREALDQDSMDFMNFVIDLSQGSGRKIPDADTPRLRTLRSLLAYLGG